MNILHQSNDFDELYMFWILHSTRCDTDKTFRSLYRSLQSDIDSTRQFPTDGWNACLFRCNTKTCRDEPSWRYAWKTNFTFCVPSGLVLLTSLLFVIGSTKCAVLPLTHADQVVTFKTVYISGQHSCQSYRTLTAVVVLRWGQGAQPTPKSCPGPNFFNFLVL